MDQKSTFNLALQTSYRTKNSLNIKINLLNFPKMILNENRRIKEL